MLKDCANRESMKSPEERVAAFLHYGFVPGAPSLADELPWARATPEEEVPERSLARGADMFRQACASLVEPDPLPGDHIVPLSGGLDSRLVLATLLELGLGSRIIAVTFGTPGTLDFELGREIARHAGVRHEAIPLSEVRPRASQLAATLASGGRWVHLFEAFYNRLVPELFGDKSAYWSGLMANTINGSQCGPPGESWQSARLRFAGAKRFADSLPLAPPDYAPESALPEAPPPADVRLTPYEYLYAGLVYPFRYEPTLVVPGFDFRMPFKAPAWVDFALSLSSDQRSEQRHYRNMAASMAPELFALPSKTSFGVRLDAPRWRTSAARFGLRAGNRLRRSFPWLGWAPNRKVNYVDFDLALRPSGSLHELVEPGLERLVEHRAVPWLDPFAIWDQHRRSRRNHGEALVLLLSLEASLTWEARNRPTATGPS